MKISVNGQQHEVNAQNLRDLLTEMEYEDLPVATAHNHDFVRAQDRDKIVLKEGDEVEILTPRQGG